MFGIGIIQVAKDNNRTSTEKQRKRITNRIKDEQALKLRLGGASYVAIATSMAYPSANSAAVAVRRALSRHPEDEKELEIARRIQTQRLDTALVGISNAVRNGNLQAIDRLVAVETLRAKLIGTFAPEQKNNSGTITINEHHDYTGLTEEQRREQIGSILEQIASRNRISISESNTAGSEPTPVIDAEVVEIPREVLE